LGVPQTLGLATGVALSLGVLAGGAVLMAPAVADQVSDLLTNLPKYFTDLDRNINRWSEASQCSAGMSPPPARPAFSGFVRGAAVPYLRGGVEFLIGGVSVLVMAVYLARHPGVYVEGIVAMVPPPRRRLARDILADLEPCGPRWWARSSPWLSSAG
jgi:predicted PurR-regulated permease PerM